jgi:hypothetical protein
MSPRPLASTVLALAVAGAASAEAPHKPPPGVPASHAANVQSRAWAEVGRLPDFTTGIWEIPLGPGSFRENSQPTLTAAYAARLKTFQEAQKAGKIQDSPAANCVPPGMPQIMGQPYPMEIFFKPGQVAIQLEAYEQIRHVYTDGRKHPDDPDQTYNGDSIGHWEGDTLVIDTVGFTPDTPLGLSYGMRHSDKLHIVERMRLKDPDSLEVVTTIDDPEALTQPWTTSRTFKRHRDWSIAEYVCEQNNRNLVDPTGRAGIILAPPGGN